MQKSRGVVLALTIMFILIFTIFGLTAIYFSGLQNQMTEKVNMGIQAFWLAEAGINRAIRNFTGPLNTNAFNSDDDSDISKDYNAKLATYRYDVPAFVHEYPDSSDHTKEYWIITSTGFVGSASEKANENYTNTKKRTIRVTTMQTLVYIDTIVKSKGALTFGGDTGIYGKTEDLTKVDDDLFYDIFGISQADLRANNNPVNPNLQYIAATNSDDVKNATIQKITWVDYSGNAPIFTVSGNLDGSGLLIMDLRNQAGGLDTLKITGNLLFNGIIWVIGNLDVNGTTEVNGSIFIEGPVAAFGTPDMTYSFQRIKEALSWVPTASDDRYKLKILKWEEIF